MSDSSYSVTDRLFDLERQFMQLFSSMRIELIRSEEERRRLLADAERFKLEVFTEEEAAARLRMSQDTLQRLRKKKSLPHFREGMLVRYTSEHLARIVRILERPQIAEVKQQKRA